VLLGLDRNVGIVRTVDQAEVNQPPKEGQRWKLVIVANRDVTTEAGDVNSMMRNEALSVSLQRVTTSKELADVLREEKPNIVWVILEDNDEARSLLESLCRAVQGIDSVQLVSLLTCRLTQPNDGPSLAERLISEVRVPGVIALYNPVGKPPGKIPRKIIGPVGRAFADEFRLGLPIERVVQRMRVELYVQHDLQDQDPFLWSGLWLYKASSADIRFKPSRPQIELVEALPEIAEHRCPWVDYADVHYNKREEEDVLRMKEVILEKLVAITTAEPSFHELWRQSYRLLSYVLGSTKIVLSEIQILRLFRELEIMTTVRFVEDVEELRGWPDKDLFLFLLAVVHEAIGTAADLEVAVTIYETLMASDDERVRRVVGRRLFQARLKLGLRERRFLLE
jgi:hypothetical protein